MADITFLQATVGPASNLADGASAAVRLSRQSGMMTAQASPFLQEAVRRGKTFGFAAQAGVTTQAGLSLTTPAATLYNPLGSGVNAVLWYAGVNFSVAFAAAAAVWLAANTNPAAAAVTGTASTTHRNMLLGAASNPACVPLLAATLPAAPVALCTLGMGLTGAITTAPVVNALERWFNGSIILTPGTAISIQTSTASGASAAFCEYIWEEIAV
jgi:hypothetical protein